MMSTWKVVIYPAEKAVDEKDKVFVRRARLDIEQSNIAPFLTREARELARKLNNAANQADWREDRLARRLREEREGKRKEPRRARPNPKVNPRPGDVLMKGKETRYVEQTGGSAVQCLITFDGSTPSPNRYVSWIAPGLSQWRRWAKGAKVVKRAAD